MRRTGRRPSPANAPATCRATRQANNRGIKLVSDLATGDPTPVPPHRHRPLG